MNMFVLTETKPKATRIEIVEALGNQSLTKQARDNAVVVAGDTLATIQDDDDLVKEFIDLCEGANVVAGQCGGVACFRRFAAHRG